jgi:hypothetical protein
MKPRERHVRRMNLPVRQVLRMNLRAFWQVHGMKLEVLVKYTQNLQMNLKFKYLVKVKGKIENILWGQ